MPENRHTHWTTRRKAATAGIAVGYLVASTATALSIPSAASAAPSKPAAATSLSVEQAMAQAKRTGKPVEATAAGTSTSTFTASPDGLVELTQTAVPTRTRVDGQWKELDPTLVRRADGSVTAAVTSTPIRLSAGGTGPFAEMTSGDRSFAMAIPLALPAPTLSGPTATYTDVLPDVDLTVRVTGDGSFSHVFIVKSPAAAANPALASIELNTTTKGVTLTADEAGNITGRDRASKPVLTAPAPIMWDSTAATAPAARGALSTTVAPGRAAKTAAVDVKITPGKLNLTPDGELLTDPKTVYPVYIDPTFTWTPVGQSKTGWATISYQHQSTNYWKNTPDLIGRMQVGNSGSQRSNTLINFPVPYGTLGGAEIFDAIFKITNTRSWSCTDKTVNIYGPGNTLAQSNATWNYWEGVSKGSAIASKSFAYGYSGCAAAGVSFDITGQIRSDVTNKKSTRTLWMVAANEASDTESWKEFLDTSPTLTIRYNHTPSTPTGMKTDPTTSCTATTPTVVGDTAVTLYAPVSDPNKGTLGVTFKLWKASDTTQKPIDLTDPNLLTYSSGSTAVRIVPRELLSKNARDAADKPVPTTFAWAVQVTDFRKPSNWSATCRFTFDATRAAPPEVTVPDTSTVGKPVTFQVTAPSTGTKPTSYAYQLNAAPPLTVGADANGNASITITPTRFTNTLSVTSITAGGNNFGDTTAKVFNSARPIEPAVDGDMTGDGMSDLLAVGSANNLKPGLWLAENNGAIGVNPSVTNIGTRGNGSSGTYSPADFDGSQVISGHFTGTGFQDVLAYYPTTGTGSIIAGNGDGSALTPELEVSQFNVMTDLMRDEHGQLPTQLANAGYSRGSGYSFPDLIGTSGDATNEHQLMYYPSFEVPAIFGARPADARTPTGETGWNNWTIATTQTSTGTAMFLWNRITGALYLWSDIAFSEETGQLSYASSRVLVDSGWDTDAAAVLRAGDFDLNGVPDLATITAGATTTVWTVSNLQAGTATITAQLPQTLITSDHTWQFDDHGDGAVTTAEDMTGGKALNVEDSDQDSEKIDARWRSDELFSPALFLNVDDTGTLVKTSGNSALYRTEPLIDTTKSFSISVWAKPTAAGGVIASEDGANASRFLLWNNASDNTWRFGLGNSDSGWSYTQVVTPAGTALGVWTHLVATYNAETRTISLYINGVLKGNAQYNATVTWPGSGKFVVGRYLYQAQKTAYYAGMLSNLQVWKRALTPTQVGATNAPPTGARNPFGSTTWTPPGTGTAQTDIYTTDTNGNLWKYRKQLSPPDPAKQLSAPRLVSTGWNQFTPFGIADMNHDGYQDLVARDNTSCNLQVFLGTSDDVDPKPTTLGNGWCGYRPFGVADWNQDTFHDVIAAGGNNDMWIYPGDLKGGKLPRYDVGDGWSSSFSSYGVANVIGDKTPDVYARVDSTGELRRYDFAAATVAQVGLGWGGYTSFGLTDFNRDGKPDILARENSTGILWIYPGITDGLLGARSQIATGW
ncbi:LamG-like jellyroll fold domain-containing protein [Micromonospora sp. NPDC048909]|uniref:LamG-like jellyroll fold domain-containing protein n=1 Tax=Micromonospora sp. NPDC048909 TaxID=3155643 RepID=UPI0033CE039B